MSPHAFLHELGELQAAVVLQQAARLQLQDDLRALAYRVVAEAAVVEGQTPPQQLTCREREVATLIAQGLTNRQIAEQLVIAERTADTHVQNLLAKVGCASRSQVAGVLATLAQQSGDRLELTPPGAASANRPTQ